jgi:GntR family transcriptional regulator/MocR family aminotransferase
MERAIWRLEGATLQPFPLDRASRRPLYLQVRDFLHRRILDGSLWPGARLPSTRSLAKSLAISRNSVLRAYEELAVEGLVTGRIGSGTRVRRHGRKPTLDWRNIVRESHFPTDRLPFRDPDGSPLYIHR